VEENTRGISDTDVRDVILRRDGGALLIAERHHEVQRGTVAGRGFMREGTRLIIDYYYDDMFVWAFNPDGKTHWNSVLHKKQYSQDDEGVFSSYFLHRKAENLHFLFNDEIKYENKPVLLPPDLGREQQLKIMLEQYEQHHILQQQNIHHTSYP
jgi:hypothetical protein